jgi:hypothetical protein
MDDQNEGDEMDRACSRPMHGRKEKRIQYSGIKIQMQDHMKDLDVDGLCY